MDSNQKWQQAALYDLEFTGLSYQEIGDKYGRSRATIIKLRDRFRITRREVVERMGPKKASDMKSLSQAHRSLGSRMTVYRANKLLTQIAEELGVSRHVLKMMEIGAHDFTLTELSRIATMLNTSIQDLVAPIILVQPQAPKDRHAR